MYYYPLYKSFYDRPKSCQVSDEANKTLLQIKKGSDYVRDKHIQTIDFLKMDTEGYELHVLKGFGDFLPNIRIIQFEYGGTNIDNDTKLLDMVQYLEQHGFSKFSYLTNDGPVRITDFSDHYQYCNIVCIHKNSTYVPF